MPVRKDHAILALDLVELAQQHMLSHDRLVKRWWSPRSRRKARWSRRAATYVISVAQVHASLARAELGDTP